jgi:hypothetical protein
MESGLVIGLCGYAGSGKDCAARGLTAGGWLRIAFADGIRDVLIGINPKVAGPYCLREVVATSGWDEAKKYAEIRRLLQYTGTAVRAVIGDNAWVSVAEMKMFEAGSQNVICTDTRFPAEVDMIREFGGAIVRITRPGVGPVNGHNSETAIDDIEPDYNIVNDGTAEELQAKLVAFAASLEKAAA